jgi:thymidine kinase
METKKVTTESTQKKGEIVRMQPNVDTRIKTEDVTARKGLSFQDFKLSDDLMLVSKI